MEHKPQEVMRLQRYLARSGIDSRRKCEELIVAGRVSVNGEIVTQLGTKVDPASDSVKLDGKEVFLQDSSVVLMLNKPLGYLTAMSDPHGKKCVSSLMPLDRYPGLYPIGRLDKNTTGLLLFTNDGDLGQQLIHPRFHVGKTYLVRFKGAVSEKKINRLEQGVVLDKRMTQPARVELLSQDSKSSLVKMTIFEGRYRQIRRMGLAIGHPVADLRRIAIGALLLGDLPSGEWRMVSLAERSLLSKRLD